MKIIYEKRESFLVIWEGSELTFPLHLHNELEIVYCTGGRLNAACDGHSVTLNENECMFAMPNTIHSYETADACDFIMCIFSPDSFPLFRQNFKKTLLSPFCQNGSGIMLRPYFNSLLEEWYGDKDEALMISYLSVILSLMFKQNTLLDKPPAGYDDILPGILQYLDENFKEPLTLNQIAAEFGLNPSYLSRFFSDRTHTPLIRYLHDLKINYAKHLLIHTKKPVTDIVFECGFLTQRTFNRVFFQLVHLTPSEFRKRNI